MALLSSSPMPPTTARLPTTLSPKPLFSCRVGFQRPTLLPRRPPSLLLSRSANNGAGAVASSSTTVLEEQLQEEVVEEESIGSNGSPPMAAEPSVKFKDSRWVGGTWDLTRFQKAGMTDWDAVIDAEARRRKWLEDNPEASTTEEPVVFDTSIIPWWSWIKRFHLPEAEKLNGRAAMVGFFMAYFVDSLTGAGLVDQMGNFFCKTLLLVAVLGVLFIRKNEDFETLKKLYEETTFYDKQWQATWQEEKSSTDSNN